VAQRHTLESRSGPSIDHAEVAVQYWYNVTTGRVESDEERSRGADVLGPYSSQDEASKALETARARTEKWDREDREWQEGGTGTGPEGGGTSHQP